MWLRNIALCLALLWAGWWTFFGLASGFGERLSLVGVVVHTAVPGIVFLASALAAWRWTVVGGIVLLIEGLLVLIIYPIMVAGRFPKATIAFVLLTMAVPPLLAGCLLLTTCWNAK